MPKSACRQIGICRNIGKLRDAYSLKPLLGRQSGRGSLPKLVKWLDSVSVLCKKYNLMTYLTNVADIRSHTPRGYGASLRRRQPTVDPAYVEHDMEAVGWADVRPSEHVVPRFYDSIGKAQRNRAEPPLDRTSAGVHEQA